MTSQAAVCAPTLDARASVMMCHGLRMRAVARMIPDSPASAATLAHRARSASLEPRDFPGSGLLGAARAVAALPPCSPRLPHTLLVRSLLWAEEGTRANGHGRRLRGAVPVLDWTSRAPPAPRLSPASQTEREHSCSSYSERLLSP
jgi:hypothetical protein